MRREIKFRGKAIMSINELDELEIEHDNGWVFGNLIQDGTSAYIIGGIAEATDEFINHDWWVKVNPKTVGQFTGLLDKNGSGIYEGDVVHLSSDDGINYSGLIIFKDGGFCAIDGPEDDYALRRYGLMRSELNIEIIGNIFQNGELLRDC